MDKSLTSQGACLGETSMYKIERLVFCNRIKCKTQDDVFFLMSASNHDVAGDGSSVVAIATYV